MRMCESEKSLGRKTDVQKSLSNILASASTVSRQRDRLQLTLAAGIIRTNPRTNPSQIPN